MTLIFRNKSFLWKQWTSQNRIYNGLMYYWLVVKYFIDHWCCACELLMRSYYLHVWPVWMLKENQPGHICHWVCNVLSAISVIQVSCNCYLSLIKLKGQDFFNLCLVLFSHQGEFVGGMVSSMKGISNMTWIMWIWTITTSCWADRQKGGWSCIVY